MILLVFYFFYVGPHKTCEKIFHFFSFRFISSFPFYLLIADSFLFLQSRSKDLAFHWNRIFLRLFFSSNFRCLSIKPPERYESVEIDHKHKTNQTQTWSTSFSLTWQMRARTHEFTHASCTTLLPIAISLWFIEIYSMPAPFFSPSIT